MSGAGNAAAGQHILNFGSLNIDHVYRLAHIVRPGETLATDTYEMFAGGKGANQSAALSLAGAHVRHAGCTGADGLWLRDGLAELGVDVSGIRVHPTMRTGHAIIQVEDSGENAICLFAGCNHGVDDDHIEAVFDVSGDSAILLLQNEINNIHKILLKAAGQTGTIVLNPAPFDNSLLDLPLDLIDLFVLNQLEAAGLTGLAADSSPAAMADTLRQRWPRAAVLLTLGAQGALYCGPAGRWTVDAVCPGPVVDTTAAGDTFVGYFVAALAAGTAVQASLHRAAAAAGICVTRPGARSSIPRRDEVEQLLATMASGAL